MDLPDVERLSAELHHLAIQAGLAGRDAEMDTLLQAADFLPQLWNAGYRSGHTDGRRKLESPR